MFGFFNELYVQRHRISTELSALPAVQLNKKEFRRQYRLNRKEWDAAIDFLRDTDINSLAPGRHDITERTFANVVEYTTAEEKPFEAHRDYIDVQFVVKGHELVEVAPLSCVGEVSIPYSEESDVVFYAGASKVDEILIGPESFCILFPEDVHKPGLIWEKPCEIKKAIVKIPFIK